MYFKPIICVVLLFTLISITASLECTPPSMVDTRPSRFGCEQRVIFAVITSTKTKKRAEGILASWGQRAEHLVFFSDGEKDTTLFPVEWLDMHTEFSSAPALEHGQKVIVRGGNDYWTAQKRYPAALQWIWRHLGQEVDWVFLCDDDTFVIVPNLLSLLGEYDASKPLYIGQAIHSPVPTSDRFASGGAGYALSGALLEKLVPILDTCTQVPSLGRRQWQDVVMGVCIEQLNVKVTHSQYFHSQAPHFYCQPFGWLESPSGMPPHPVSFHYTQPEDFVRMDEIWAKAHAPRCSFAPAPHRLKPTYALKSHSLHLELFMKNAVSPEQVTVVVCDPSPLSPQGWWTLMEGWDRVWWMQESSLVDCVDHLVANVSSPNLFYVLVDGSTFVFPDHLLALLPSTGELHGAFASQRILSTGVLPNPQGGWILRGSTLKCLRHVTLQDLNKTTSRSMHPWPPERDCFPPGLWDADIDRIHPVSFGVMSWEGQHVLRKHYQCAHRGSHYTFADADKCFTDRDTSGRLRRTFDLDNVHKWTC